MRIIVIENIQNQDLQRLRRQHIVSVRGYEKADILFPKDKEAIIELLGSWEPDDRVMVSSTFIEVAQYKKLGNIPEPKKRTG